MFDVSEAHVRVRKLGFSLSRSTKIFTENPRYYVLASFSFLRNRAGTCWVLQGRNDLAVGPGMFSAVSLLDARDFLATMMHHVSQLVRMFVRSLINYRGEFFDESRYDDAVGYPFRNIFFALSCSSCFLFLSVCPRPMATINAGSL